MRTRLIFQSAFGASVAFASACGSGGASGETTAPIDTTSSVSMSSSAGAGGNTGEGGAGAGSSSATMTNCDPTAGAVDGSCGIFVSSSMGHDTDDGSKTNPVKTLAHAIDLAATNGSRVYACGEEFDEAITLPAGTSLYGALDCAHGWGYAASTPSAIVAPADAIAVTVSSGSSSSLIEDFSVTAADATVASGSSIGVLASADLDLERVSIAAGKGHDGQLGAPQTQVAPGASGAAGADDATCNVSMRIDGGAGGTQLCGATDVSGGAGGDANTSGNGGTGTAGSGTPQAAPFDGAGGPGQSLALPCVAGDAGGNGAQGPTGSGAGALGTITPSGYTPPSASAGAGPGLPGQGGGGGGGAKPCAVGFAGPSGGGGGGGRCGGDPGNAGTSGGASLGLVARGGATLTLRAVSISTSQAGGGGVGGDGQPGGNGGSPGHAPMSSAACDGGRGGQGGRGGSGGGGAGGPSVAIAVSSAALPDLTTTTLVHGAAGAGALGGDGDVTANGADGLGCTTLDFGDASSCAP